MIQKLTQFRLGIFMILFESFMFGTSAINGHFNSMIFLCIIYWVLWTIYFWNQRGKKCYLKVIPLNKNSIEIGDLISENADELANMRDPLIFPYDTNDKISVCLVNGGQGYSSSAKPIQLVIVADEKLKTGDTYLNCQSKELRVYDPNCITADDALSSLIGMIEDIYMKKLVMLQKDMPQEFIQTVIDGKTQDGDVIIVRKDKVFKEKPFYKNDLLIGCVLLFFCVIIGNLIYTSYNIFDKNQIIGRAITLAVGGLLILPVLFHAIKFILKHYKQHDN